MKSHIRVSALTLLLAAGTAAALLAQPGGGWNADPAQRAEQQTATMTEKLALSEAQAGKVKDINLKYAQKMKEARDNAGDDRDAMRATIGTIRAEQDKELQTVLTEEQWQTWTKYREELRANRGNRGNPPTDQPPSDGKKKKSKKGKQKSSDSGSEQ